MKPMNKFYPQNPMIHCQDQMFKFVQVADCNANDQIVQPINHYHNIKTSYTHKVTGLFTRLVTPRIAL